MENANREFERISGKYSSISKRRIRVEDGRNEDVFSIVRRARESKEKDLKQGKKIIKGFEIFFNQHKMAYTYEYINTMDLEDLMMTYELLIDQDIEQAQSYENMLG